MKVMKLVAAATVSVALILGSSVPASAAMVRAGTVRCPSNYSYTVANSTSSTVHFHEHAGWFKKVDRRAGRGDFRGWYQKSAVWVEIHTNGSVSQAAIGCAG